MRKMKCGRRRGGRVENTERGGRGEGNAHIISMLKAYLQTLVRRGGRKERRGNEKTTDNGKCGKHKLTTLKSTNTIYTITKEGQ